MTAIVIMAKNQATRLKTLWIYYLVCTNYYYLHQGGHV